MLKKYSILTYEIVSTILVMILGVTLHYVYDWSNNPELRAGFVTDSEMASLYRNGAAREFSMNGRQDVTLTWCKGQRFKADGRGFKKQLAETE